MPRISQSKAKSAKSTSIVAEAIAAETLKGLLDVSPTNDGVGVSSTEMVLDVDWETRTAMLKFSLGDPRLSGGGHLQLAPIGSTEVYTKGPNGERIPMRIGLNSMTVSSRQFGVDMVNRAKFIEKAKDQVSPDLDKIRAKHLADLCSVIGLD